MAGFTRLFHRVDVKVKVRGPEILVPTKKACLKTATKVKKANYCQDVSK